MVRMAKWYLVFLFCVASGSGYSQLGSGLTGNAGLHGFSSSGNWLSGELNSFPGPLSGGGRTEGSTAPSGVMAAPHYTGGGGVWPRNILIEEKLAKRTALTDYYLGQVLRAQEARKQLGE